MKLSPREQLQTLIRRIDVWEDDDHTDYDKAMWLLLDIKQCLESVVDESSLDPMEDL